MDVKFDEVQNYILPRLVYKDNVGSMSYSRPFIGDISIIFRILLEESDDIAMSIIVSPKMMADWNAAGISYSTVFEQAKRNWFEQNVLCTLDFGYYNVISVKDLRFGAACIIDPYIFKNFVQKACDITGDFYFIPSSIHEVLVLKDGAEGLDVKDMKEMLHDVNSTRTCVPEKDVLSYNILKYNSETKQIEIAEG